MNVKVTRAFEIDGVRQEIDALLDLPDPLAAELIGANKAVRHDGTHKAVHHDGAQTPNAAETTDAAKHGKKVTQ